MKKLCFNLIIVIGFNSFITAAYATSYQRTIDLAYDNPALLKTVNKSEVLLGDSYIYGIFQFVGKLGALTGSATSRQHYNYPYGRIAFRINPKIVAGVDITHLEYANIVFPLNSIVSKLLTATIIKSIDVVPKVSYQLTRQIALGGALNIDNTYDLQVNNIVPPFGNLVNKAADRGAIGWGVGATYAPSSTTNLELSYFSKIMHHVTGTSTWGPFENNHYKLNYPLPALASLGISKSLGSKWLLKAMIRYQWYEAFQALVLQNTALGQTLNLPQGYRNTWVGLASAHYQVDEKWGVLVGSEYNTDPQPLLYRSVGLAGYSATALIGGIDYAFTKEFSAKLTYAHIISFPPLDKVTRVGLLTGKEFIQVNNFDLLFIWRI
ncbi:outer membrane protein [Legionella steigerwaltii]|uniref:Outer membrane protein n=1 Tax=Legionella steigerwaltii TaxID=460 RepID=A0A378LCV6_9GAMM|nr:outer membrane protein transport protein [Legionella steigerwaltii]KTD75355.1 outer membrane protein [Legionella steigerwaltii]STY23712.1 outer membrane protein [Legionella steigerwaltii]